MIGRLFIIKAQLWKLNKIIDLVYLPQFQPKGWKWARQNEHARYCLETEGMKICYT
jgi:hypothetical protein